MESSFRRRVIEKIRQKGSLVCVGLDPDPSAPQFPPEYRERAHAKLEFGKALVDAVHDLVPAVKPNTRFYDPGEWQDLRALVRYAHAKDLEVIGDCKENDIGTTMARAYQRQFETFEWDAITVNAYLGRDGIVGPAGQDIYAEWFQRGKGLFVLVKTSNPSSADLQDRRIPTGTNAGTDKEADIPVFQHVARAVERWSAPYDFSIGAVVGATHPGELALLRDELSGIILAPGYGAQGGTADAITGAVTGDRYCLVNSSRGIMYAHARRFRDKYKAGQFPEAARAEVEFMNADLARALSNAS